LRLKKKTGRRCGGNGNHDSCFGKEKLLTAEKFPQGYQGSVERNSVIASGRKKLFENQKEQKRNINDYMAPG